MVNRYLSSTIWEFGASILRLTLGFIVTAYVARFLGPEKFGVLNFAQSYVGLISVLALLGLPGVLVRELVNRRQNDGRIIGSAIVMSVFASLAMFSLINLSAFYMDVSESERVVVVILSFSILFQSSFLIDSYFQSIVKSKYSASSKIFSLTISAAFKVILVLIGAPLHLFAAAILIESILMLVFNILSYWHFGGGKSISHSLAKSEMIYLFRNAWPYIFSGLLISIYMKVDQLMIASMVGSYELGQYAAAAKICEAVYFVPMILCGALFPAILNAKRQNKAVYVQRIKDLYSFLIYLSLMLSLVISFASEYLTYIVYGEQYDVAAKIMSVHIWASLFVFVGVANGKWILAEGLQKYHLTVVAFGAVSNVVLNIVLIPDFGGVGAAWATVVSYSVSGYFSLFLLKKTRDCFWLINKSIFVNPIPQVVAIVIHASRGK